MDGGGSESGNADGIRDGGSASDLGVVISGGVAASVAGFEPLS